MRCGSLLAGRDFGGRDLVGRASAAMADATDHADLALSTGRHERHCRTSVCRQDRNQIAAADRGREPARCRGHRRFARSLTRGS